MPGKSVVNPQPSFSWVGCLAVALAALLLYLPTVTHEFTFDDGTIVANNPAVQEWGNWRLIFFSDYWPAAHSALYRPVTILSYALEKSLHGSGPAGFHFVNIVLHAATSSIVFLLATELIGGRWGPILAALLFAVHPLHTEVVSGVVGRAELLSTLLALAAFWTAIRNSPQHSGRALQPILFFFLALGSKENVVILPAVLIVWELSRLPPGSRFENFGRLFRSRTLWGYFGVVVVFLLLRSVALGGFEASLNPAPASVENPLQDQVPSVRALNALANQWRGLTLHVLPWPLIADYSLETLPVVRQWLNLRAMSMPVFTAVCLGFWGIKSKLGRNLAFLSSWYLLAVFPTSNIALVIGTIFAERLFYFPSVPFCLAVGLLVAAAAGSSAANWIIPRSMAGKVVLGTCSLAIVVVAAVTLVRNPVWKNDLALFTDTVQRAPRNVKARLWLGDALVRSGEDAAAIKEYLSALEIHPAYAPAAANLMVPLMRLHRNQEAIETGEKARSLFREENAGLLYNLAMAYLEVGEPVRFLSYMDKVLKLEPRNSRVHVRLGMYYFQHAADRSAARRHFEQALRLEPSTEEAVKIRNLLARLGDFR